MQPKKVLVVDDSKLMHKMYEVILRQYPLLYATDGRKALDRLHQHPDVELILLDTNMPGMDGDQTETLAGADATIAKPFSAEELLAKIAAL
jgi:two-component system, chemotaxis family, chemotaxis protein CheY